MAAGALSPLSAPEQEEKNMCRWLAYSGGPIALSELIFNTEHSLIDQSLSARSSAQTTNGDGFGVGWYDQCAAPGLYKHTQPAWNDPNLKDLCTHTQSPMFVAHIRAATGTAIQQTNCHPFRHGRCLFVHNGNIRGYQKLRRELAFALEEEYFSGVTGTTDSELMFFLALHFGMAEDVYTGVARMAGFIERLGRDRGIELPLQMTLGIADGERLYAVRYSSERESRTLFRSRNVAALRELAPPESQGRFEGLSDDALAIVSEPWSDLPYAWEEIPESTFVTVERGQVENREFIPLAP
jgi:glutamine amidotransferase